MKRYDFIIAGGGLAGLSLAYRLAAGPLRDCSMLIVDRSLKPRNDRTWAFWAKERVPFDNLARQSWDHMLVATVRTKQILDLGPYTYKAIRGKDFYRFAHERLARLPNVELMQGRVESVGDGVEAAKISVGGQEYEGTWVFDSRFRLAGFHPAARGTSSTPCYLKMQFRGWEIETQDDCFDVHTPTFLDFRTPQLGRTRFLYVLPYCERRALVEYVICTDKLIDAAEQTSALQKYIQDVLGARRFRVVAQEQGINPMTGYKFLRRKGRHVMTVGIPAGMLKPTTGFAFTRIQRDSVAIARSLLEHGQPFNVPASPLGYRLYESLMLRGMAHYGGKVGSLLTMFFKYGSTERILGFLDERGAPF